MYEFVFEEWAQNFVAKNYVLHELVILETNHSLFVICSANVNVKMYTGLSIHETVALWFLSQDHGNIFILVSTSFIPKHYKLALQNPDNAWEHLAL